MSKRKSIFAIGLFIFAGFFIYSFARPNRTQKEEDKKTPKTEEKVNDSKNQKEDNEDTTDGELVVEDTTGSEEGTIVHVDSGSNQIVEDDIVVPTNFDLLKKIIEFGEEIINGEGVSNYLGDLIDTLDFEIALGNSTLHDSNATQSEVDTRVSSINNVIKDINNFVDSNLINAIEEGNEILDSSFNETTDILGELGNILENGSNNENSLLFERISFLNKLKEVIGKWKQFLKELEIINNAEITLTASTVDWTNKDVTLTLKIDGEGIEELISKYKIVMYRNSSKEIIKEFNEGCIGEVEINQNGFYVGEVHFKNGVKKEFASKIKISKIDNVAPYDVEITTLINGESVSLDDWTNQTVSLNFTAKDNRIKSTNLTYEYSNSLIGKPRKWTKITRPLVFSENIVSNIYVRAIDKAGNVSEPASIKLKIDKTGPRVYLLGPKSIKIEAGKEEYREYGSFALDLYPLFGGKLSFEKIIERKISDNEWEEVNSIEVTEPNEYEVTYKYTDLANNQKQVVRRVIIKDTTSPEVTLEPLEDNNIEYGEGNYIEPGYEAIDLVDGNLNTNVIETLQYNNSGNWEEMDFDNTLIGEWKIDYFVKDNSSNSTIVSRYFNVVDTQNPLITIKDESEGNFDEKIFKKVSFKLYDNHLVSHTELNGKRKEYNPNNWSDYNNIIPGFGGAIEGKNTIVLYDTSGNSYSLDFELDTTAPVIVGRENQTILESGSYFDFRKPVRIQPSDKNLGKLFVNDVEYPQYYGDTSQNIDWIVKNDITTDTFVVISEDKAGNKSDEYVIKLDREKPILEVYETIDGKQTKIKNGAIVNINNKIQTKAEDMHLLKLVVNNKDKLNYIPRTDGKIHHWNDINGILNQTTDSEFILYAEDKYGNKSDEFIIKVDRKKPCVELLEPMEDIIIKPGIVKVKVKATDDLELEKLVINLYKNNELIKGFFTKDDGATELVYEHELNNLIEGIYEVRINAHDSVGNVSNTIRKEIKVDKIKPYVEVLTPISPLITNEGNFNVFVNATDNYGLKQLIMNLHKDGTVFEGKSVPLEGLEKYIEEQFENIPEGEYTLKINAKDLVGLTSNTVVIPILIDKTTPQIELIGESYIELEIGDNYVDQGANVTDNFSENLQVIITGLENVDTRVAGTYIIKYNVTDEAGNDADEVIRTVVVNEAEEIEPMFIIQNSSSKNNGITTLTLNIKLNNGYNFNNVDDLEIILSSPNKDKKVVFTLKEDANLGNGNQVTFITNYKNGKINSYNFNEELVCDGQLHNNDHISKIEVSITINGKEEIVTTTN